MPDVERTIRTPTPLPRVWDFLTDFTSTERWDPPTVSCERVSGDGGVGTEYKNVSKVLGSETEIRYTVIDVEPQRLFRVKGETSSMSMIDTITFATEGDETVLTYHADFTPEGAAKLAEPLMPIGLKRLGDKTADQMKEVLDAL